MSMYVVHAWCFGHCPVLSAGGGVGVLLCSVGWLKGCEPIGRDSCALKSTAAVVGDEGKLSEKLFTINSLFSEKEALR